MKTLFTLMTLALMFNISFAQTEIVAQQDTPRSASEMTKAPKKAQQHYLAHSQDAVQQIKTHIAKNLVYPEILRQHNYEGQVIIEVSISEAGQIEKAEVLKSPSQLFDKAVQKALSSLKRVKVKDRIYQGSKKIHVPVKFSIQ